MNFEDEEYRRLYIRRTVTNRRLGWEGRAVMHEMLYEFDRAGVWDVSEDPAEDISVTVGLPLEFARVGLQRLLATGTWLLNGKRLVWPRHLEAQTCPRSDRLRQQESRARRASDASPKTRATEGPGHELSRPSHGVTEVTSEQSSTMQCNAEQSERGARAHGSVPEVPGLAIVHPLPPSKRDQELDAAAYGLTTNGVPRHEFTPGWTPGKSSQARGHELGLTDEEIWARWETCKDRYFTAPFRSDVKQFNRELAFAAQDKTTNRFKSLPQSERNAFENPGRERRPA
jgi:hypothetical protein